MLSVLSNRLGLSSTSSSLLPPSPPAPPRASSSFPSFSFDVTPDSDEEEVDGGEELEPRTEQSKLTTTTTNKTGMGELGKRKRVVIEPGYSQLDWARLKSSGADLRAGHTMPLKVTPSMLALHKTREDCWQVYNGKVYNVTPYLKYHPGGVRETMRAAGKDGTELFMKTHAWINVDSMLEGCMIGYLVRE